MTRWHRLHLGITYAFLYLPIVVLMILSFNRAGLPTAWGGFSLEWYGKLFANPKIQQAAFNSFVVAVISTLIATAIGLFAAIPAVIAYNRYTAEIDRLATRYESFMEEFTNILQRQATH